MHIVVVGCGRVGSELAGHLERNGHSVAIVDKNANAFRRLPSEYGGRAIVGYGFDRDTLLEAGIEDADALAAVTNGDNSNILTARVARETFQVAHVAARIYDPRRAVIYERLGITTVATVSWTTDQVLRRVLPGEHHADWIDPSGRIGLVELALPDAWAGKPLEGLDLPGSYWLVGITRLGKAQLTTDKVVGQEGDRLHFVASMDRIDDLRTQLDAGADGGGHQ